MTVRKTNTEGIKKAAQAKREEALERTNAAIRQLIKEGKEVSFSSVSEAANVSRAWLYKNESIRAQVENLRNQSTSTKKVPSKLKASDSSKNTLIKMLKERTKKLERENLALRNQLEVVYGLTDPQLSKIIAEQQEEIAMLKNQNEETEQILEQARKQIEALQTSSQ
jgi:hypothetical protein